MQRALLLFALVVLVAALPDHAGAQRCVTPPAGLVSWWPGDGDGGDLVDGNDGVLQAGAGFAPGFVAESFAFDGIDDHVEILDNGNLDLANTWLLDFWINPSAYPGDGLLAILVNKWVDGGEDKGALLDSEGKVQARLTGFASQRPRSRTSLPLNVWSHIAVTYDGASLRIYIDGELDATTGLSRDISDANGNLFFGRHPQREARGEDKAPFQGRLDEIEWGTAVPSAEEIRAIFAAGSAGKCKVDFEAFDRFDLEKASLKFRHPGWDSFHFSAGFDLSADSDGIDPGGEDVTVSVGTYTETLPAGAFDCTGSECLYDSRGPGITNAAIANGYLEFRAVHVDLSGTANPAEILVQIGDDSGEAFPRLGGRLLLCGLGFELAFLLPPLVWLRQKRRRGMMTKRSRRNRAGSQADRPGREAST